MQYGLDYRGVAENTHIEALVSLQSGRTGLQLLADAGEPRAFAALQLNLAAQALIKRANHALNNRGAA